MIRHIHVLVDAAKWEQNRIKQEGAKYLILGDSLFNFSDISKLNTILEREKDANSQWWI